VEIEAEETLGAMLRKYEGEVGAVRQANTSLVAYGYVSPNKLLEISLRIWIPRDWDQQSPVFHSHFDLRHLPLASH